jgi:uncharacterized membrane protein YGL010W
LRAIRVGVAAAGVTSAIVTALANSGESGLAVIFVIVWAIPFLVYARHVDTIIGVALIGPAMILIGIVFYVGYRHTATYSSTAALALGDALLLNCALVLVWLPIQRRLKRRRGKLPEPPPAA